MCVYICIHFANTLRSHSELKIIASTFCLFISWIFLNMMALNRLLKVFCRYKSKIARKLIERSKYFEKSECSTWRKKSHRWGNPSIFSCYQDQSTSSRARGQLWRSLRYIFQREIIGFRSNGTESLFLSSRWSQRQECGRRGPFVFYFLCRNRFLCGPSFAPQCFPRKSFHLTIPSHHHQSSTDSSIRDFLRLNTFCGMQKTLNYHIAYYTESLISNTRIRSRIISMTIETFQQQRKFQRNYIISISHIGNVTIHS